MFKKSSIFIFSLFLLLSTAAMAQVLGPCGSPSKKGPAPAPPGAAQAVNANITVTNDMAVKPIPLPGQQAIDFELTAVVGNEIKNIKLSDYSGKWRILCFYPADFTFV
jgi:hypothetical protein